MMENHIRNIDRQAHGDICVNAESKERYLQYIQTATRGRLCNSNGRTNKWERSLEERELKVVSRNKLLNGEEKLLITLVEQY